MKHDGYTLLIIPMLSIWGSKFGPYFICHDSFFPSFCLICRRNCDRFPCHIFIHLLATTIVKKSFFSVGVYPIYQVFRIAFCGLYFIFIKVQVNYSMPQRSIVLFLFYIERAVRFRETINSFLKHFHFRS